MSLALQPHAGVLYQFAPGHVDQQLHTLMCLLLIILRTCSLTNARSSLRGAALLQQTRLCMHQGLRKRYHAMSASDVRPQHQLATVRRELFFVLAKEESDVARPQRHWLVRVPSSGQHVSKVVCHDWRDLAHCSLTDER